MAEEEQGDRPFASIAVHPWGTSQNTELCERDVGDVEGVSVCTPPVHIAEYTSDLDSELCHEERWGVEQE